MHKPQERDLSGLDHLSVGFGIFDSELKLVSYNRQFVNLRGYPVDFVVEGTPLETLLRFNAERGDFGPGDVDAHVHERLQEIETSDKRLVEHRMPNGQILSIRYTRLDDGGLLVAIEDRTAERKAQAAMEESEQRYALISDAAEEAVYEWNIAEDLFYASPRLEAFLGIASHKGGARQWVWLDFVHEEDRTHYKEVLEAHLSGKEERWSCEYRIRTAEGTYRWVSDHGTSVRDNDGQAVRMVAALRDITERVESAAALRASEEWHALVAQATSDGLYDWNIRNNKLVVSDQLIKLFGFEADTLLSEDWANLIHEEDFQHYKEALVAHLKGQTPKLECEYRISNSAGEYRWARDQGIAERDEKGRGVRLVGAVRDITSMRAAEEELDLLQARLMDSLESLSDGFLLLDTENRVQLWNSRYLEIFGAAAGRDITHIVKKGRPFFDMIGDGYKMGMFMPHPDGAEGWLEGRRKAWSQPRADLQVELANGTWLMINERRMSDGGRVAIYTDITDLKQREEELRAQSAILEATLENMEQGISMVNDQFRAVSFNRKFLEFMQFPESKFPPGFRMEDAFRFNAERGEYGEGDVEEMVAQRMELAAKFEPHRFERTRKDGVVLEIVGNPVKTGGFVTTYTDITQRKQREDELRRARDVAEKTLSELQEAQERLIQAEKMASLGQLTAGIAHEIKNPLNFVNNFAKLSGELMEELCELLEKPLKALDEDARDDADDIIETIEENLQKIHEHGARADSIVRNMLLHSRDGPSQIQSTSINAIADEALKLAYHGARAENAGFNIEMKTDFDDNAGEIDCFPQDLMRAFLNLVSNGMYAATAKSGETNGVDASFSPEIEIKTRADGDRVHIDIKDNGIGIPEEIREKVLTPFFTTKPAGEGTGLGLSLTYDIVVKQHAGDLTIESEPGAYTVFRITLPRQLEAG